MSIRHNYNKRSEKLSAARYNTLTCEQAGTFALNSTEWHFLLLLYHSNWTSPEDNSSSFPNTVSGNAALTPVCVLLSSKGASSETFVKEIDKKVKSRLNLKVRGFLKLSRRMDEHAYGDSILTI